MAPQHPIPSPKMRTAAYSRAAGSAYHKSRRRPGEWKNLRPRSDSCTTLSVAVAESALEPAVPSEHVQRVIMQSTAWVAFLQHVPESLLNGLCIKTVSGTEVAVQSIL